MTEFIKKLGSNENLSFEESKKLFSNIANFQIFEKISKMACDQIRSNTQSFKMVIDQTSPSWGGYALKFPIGYPEFLHCVAFDSRF